MEELIPASEAARLLQVTKATVHNLVDAGKLNVKQTLGKQEQRFFDRNEVLAFKEIYRKNSRAA